MKKLALILIFVAFGVANDRQKCNDGGALACQRLIDSGLKSVETCDIKTCRQIANIYATAGHSKTALRYFEKAILLKDNLAYLDLGIFYNKGYSYTNAAKNFELACNRLHSKLESAPKAQSCYNLGVMYDKGNGVERDYYKAFGLWKQSCELKYAKACDNIGTLYVNGQGVRQDRSIAKQYYGKACDLGFQKGCDNYRRLNEQGVK